MEEDLEIDATDDNPIPTTKHTSKTEWLYWVDWCRIQSIWNVVLGHCWWTTRDLLYERFRKVDTIFVPQDHRGTDAYATSRMVEYTVDIGTLHTVPIFFLLSGYVAGKSSNFSKIPDVNGRTFHAGSFTWKRVLRLGPPFLLGSIAQCIVLGASGKEFGYDAFLFSHLWFLWALFIIQVGSIPFCLFYVNIKNYAEMNSCGKFVLYLFGHFLWVAVFVVLTRVVFAAPDNSDLKFFTSWNVAYPMASFCSLLFASLAVKFSSAEHLFHLLAPAIMIAGTFIDSLSPVCPTSNRECTEYDWLTVNTGASIAMIVSCYMIGFVTAVDGEAAWVSLSKRIWGEHTVSCIVFLLSAFWPFCSYWAEPTIRRAAFYITYDSHDDTYPGSSEQREWGYVRTWGWVLLMVSVARKFCNHQVSVFWHRHIIGSGVVLFVFHRYVETEVAAALVANIPLTSTQEDLQTAGAGLFFGTLCITVTSMLVIYAILYQTRVGRLIGGITAGPNSKP